MDLIEEKNESVAAQFKAESIQVFGSELTPEGPIYSILKEIPIEPA
ncbi:MAG: hypothetical protein GY765_07360 [bacterium]|nr:hypothetical protein [bacterium]